MGERIKWENGYAEGESFFVQTEHVRGEGVCYFLERLSPRDEDVRQRFSIETCFYGRGGVAKVKAAAQAIVDAREDA